MPSKVTPGARHPAGDGGKDLAGVGYLLICDEENHGEQSLSAHVAFDN